MHIMCYIPLYLSQDDFTPPKKAKRNPKSKKGKEKNPPADVQDSHQEQVSSPLCSSPHTALFSLYP